MATSCAIAKGMDVRFPQHSGYSDNKFSVPFIAIGSRGELNVCSPDIFTQSGLSGYDPCLPVSGHSAFDDFSVVDEFDGKLKTCFSFTIMQKGGHVSSMTLSEAGTRRF